MERLNKVLAVLAVISFLAPGCKYEDPDPYTEPMELGEYEIDADTLNLGRESYMLYCFACHGENGDGKGPSSFGLRPPPRDLRIATYKFGRAVDGLPHDEDLTAIVKNGLTGTAMLPWDIPDTTLDAIIQYIKAFSPEGEGWRDEDAELGERIEATPDPWEGKTAAAVERGKQIYHAYQCWSCHSAYATETEISAHAEAVKGKGIASFRPNLFSPEAKESAFYTARVQRKPGETAECEETSDCANEQEICVYGTCELKLKIIPPDFMYDEIRNGSDPTNLYRTIAAGIQGSGMPQWKGSVPDEDIWAVAHYVNWVAGWKGTAQVAQMKAKLRAAPHLKKVKAVEAPAAAPAVETAPAAAPAEEAAPAAVPAEAPATE